MNRPPLGQGKAAGCPQGKEEARIAPPPRPPDPLFPPPPPPHDLPSRFSQQARSSSSYPCLPSSSSANRGKTSGRQTSPPPKLPPRPAKTNPLGHPLQLLQGGPRRPGGAEPGGGGSLRWPTCRGTNPVSRGSGKGWGRGRCRAYGWAFSRGGAPGWSPWHPLFSHALGVGVK
jgi:hypothetical protein